MLPDRRVPLTEPQVKDSTRIRFTVCPEVAPGLALERTAPTPPAGVELAVLRVRVRVNSLGDCAGRGDRTRTCDLLLPKQAR